MSNDNNNLFEKRILFVAKRYKEGALDADKAWKQFAADRQIVRRIPLRRYMMAAAAVVLVLVGIGTLLVVEKNQPKWVAVNTAAGQLKDVYLPDSTLVSLAGNSSIRYDSKTYGKQRRVVEMSGKGFFQVTRNQARPFSVQTKHTEVTVLGTSFQINEQDTGTEVNVETGKVCFAVAGSKDYNVILTAGMSAEYSMEKKEIVLLTEDDTNYLSWKTGQLRFNDTPIDRVITDLEDYYQTRIINRTKNTDARLTATFNHLPLEDVLMVINQTLDVRLASDAQ